MRNLFNDVNENVYSVIGQNGAKNLIPYPYYQTSKTTAGITITDNGDGTITFDGTSTSSTVIFRLLSNDTNIEIPLNKSKYILTWVDSSEHKRYFRIDIALIKSDGTTIIVNGEPGVIDIDNTNGEYTGIYSMGVYTTSGQTVSNLTFKPMLRLAADSDDTYQPYAKTNRELTEDKAELESVRDYVNELGVKNLIPYPYYEKTHTENGVTFTDNGDGTITVDTDGSTSTRNATFYCQSTNVLSSLIKLDKNKTYIFSDPTHSGVANNYVAAIRYFAEGVTPSTSTGTAESCKESNNWQVTITNAVYATIYLYVWSGQTVSNLTFKPMLRLAADINDDTYVPFAKTNRQLTESSVNKKTTVDSFYGTCDTAAATAAKVITVVDTDNNFSLRPGVLVTVKFDNVNTANNPTFNVNNTGAKSVSYNNAVVSTDSLWAGGDSAPSLYVYDGTNWVLLAYSSYSTAQSVIVNPSSAPTDEGSIWIETT